MSLALCACPGASELTDIPEVTCGENFGQIQKIIFQRRQSPTSLTAVQAALVTNWNALLAETDDTKITVTPFFEGFTLPAVEAIKEGGDDNSTLDGTAIVVGATTPSASGSFRNLPAAVFAALELYNCEQNLWIYLINEFGKIIGSSSNGTLFEGFPISEWFIGDKSIEGKNTHNKNMFTFAMRAGWSRKAKIVTPTDFDARYDLVP